VRPIWGHLWQRSLQHQLHRRVVDDNAPVAHGSSILRLSMHKHVPGSVMCRSWALIALALFTGLSACGGETASPTSGATEGGTKDAGAKDAWYPDVGCTPELACPQDASFCATWLGPDGGVTRSQCMPASVHTECDPIQRSDSGCSCTFCEGNPATCRYNPYTAALKLAECGQ